MEVNLLHDANVVDLPPSEAVDAAALATQHMPKEEGLHPCLWVPLRGSIRVRLPFALHKHPENRSLRPTCLTVSLVGKSVEGVVFYNTSEYVWMTQKHATSTGIPEEKKVGVGCSKALDRIFDVARANRVPFLDFPFTIKVPSTLPPTATPPQQSNPQTSSIEDIIVLSRKDPLVFPTSITASQSSSSQSTTTNSTLSVSQLAEIDESLAVWCYPNYSIVATLSFSSFSVCARQTTPIPKTIKLRTCYPRSWVDGDPITRFLGSSTGGVFTYAAELPRLRFMGDKDPIHLVLALNTNRSNNRQSVGKIEKIEVACVRRYRYTDAPLAIHQCSEEDVTPAEAAGPPRVYKFPFPSAVVSGRVKPQAPPSAADIGGLNLSSSQSLSNLLDYEMGPYHFKVMAIPHAPDAAIGYWRLEHYLDVTIHYRPSVSTFGNDLSMSAHPPQSSSLASKWASKLPPTAAGILTSTVGNALAAASSTTGGNSILTSTISIPLKIARAAVWDEPDAVSKHGIQVEPAFVNMPPPPGWSGHDPAKSLEFGKRLEGMWGDEEEKGADGKGAGAGAGDAVQIASNLALKSINTTFAPANVDGRDVNADTPTTVFSESVVGMPSQPGIEDGRVTSPMTLYPGTTVHQTNPNTSYSAVPMGIQQNSSSGGVPSAAAIAAPIVVHNTIPHVGASGSLTGQPIASGGQQAYFNHGATTTTITQAAPGALGGNNSFESEGVTIVPPSRGSSTQAMQVLESVRIAALAAAFSKGSTDEGIVKVQGKGVQELFLGLAAAQAGNAPPQYFSVTVDPNSRIPRLEGEAIPPRGSSARASAAKAGGVLAALAAVSGGIVSVDQSAFAPPSSADSNGRPATLYVEAEEGDDEDEEEELNAVPPATGPQGVEMQRTPTVLQVDEQDGTLHPPPPPVKAWGMVELDDSDFSYANTPESATASLLYPNRHSTVNPSSSSNPRDSTIAVYDFATTPIPYDAMSMTSSSEGNPRLSRRTSRAASRMSSVRLSRRASSAKSPNKRASKADTLGSRKSVVAASHGMFPVHPLQMLVALQDGGVEFSEVEMPPVPRMPSQRPKPLAAEASAGSQLSLPTIELGDLSLGISFDNVGVTNQDNDQPPPVPAKDDQAPAVTAADPTSPQSDKQRSPNLAVVPAPDAAPVIPPRSPQSFIESSEIAKYIEASGAGSARIQSPVHTQTLQYSQPSIQSPVQAPSLQYSQPAQPLAQPQPPTQAPTTYAQPPQNYQQPPIQHYTQPAATGYAQLSHPNYAQPATQTYTHAQTQQQTPIPSDDEVQKPLKIAIRSGPLPEMDQPPSPCSSTSSAGFSYTESEHFYAVPRHELQQQQQQHQQQTLALASSQRRQPGMVDSRASPMPPVAHQTQSHYQHPPPQAPQVQQHFVHSAPVTTSAPQTHGSGSSASILSAVAAHLGAAAASAGQPIVHSTHSTTHAMTTHATHTTTHSTMGSYGSPPGTTVHATLGTTQHTHTATPSYYHHNPQRPPSTPPQNPVVTQHSMPMIVPGGRTSSALASSSRILGRTAETPTALPPSVLTSAASGFLHHPQQQQQQPSQTQAQPHHPQQHFTHQPPSVMSRDHMSYGASQSFSAAHISSSASAMKPNQPPPPAVNSPTSPFNASGQDWGSSATTSALARAAT
ncbi:hypothetical protein HDU97_010340, partial [Phlyctochytrium planicorne]